MKQFKYVEKQVQEKILEQTFCDKCHLDIKNESFSIYDSGWFEIKVGQLWPEGGNGDKYSLDLCENCSMELVETLKKLGYNILEDEWDC